MTGGIKMNDDDVLNETNPVKVVVIAGFVIALAIGALLFSCGCRHVSVRTPEWRASYWQFCQTTDAEKLEVQAGENISLKIGKVQGQIDPKVKDAAAKAAELLMNVAR